MARVPNNRRARHVPVGVAVPPAIQLRAAKYRNHFSCTVTLDRIVTGVPYPVRIRCTHPRPPFKLPRDGSIRVPVGGRHVTFFVPFDSAVPWAQTDTLQIIALTGKPGGGGGYVEEREHSGEMKVDP